MKLSCDIVMDLVAVYSDGAASEETAAAVREHLASCPACRKFYKSYSYEPVQEEQSPEARDFLSVASRLKRRRLLTSIGLAAYTVAAAAVVTCILVDKK